MSGRYWMARGWMDHSLFRGEPYSKAQAWCWLIEKAAWKRHRIAIGGKEIFLRRGQLSYSTRYMAKAWGWSEAKVRRVLRLFQKWSNIDAATDAGQTVITICNYDKYQAPETRTDAPIDAKVTQERRRSDANKKKGNKGNKERGCMDRRPDDLFPGSDDDAFEEFWSAYPSRGDGANPKKPAQERFLQKVAAGTPVEVLLRGARGFAASVERRRDQEGERFNPTTAVCQAVTFLNQERYNEYGPEAERPLTDEQRAALARHRGDGQGKAIPNVVSLHAGKPGER